MAYGNNKGKPTGGNKGGGKPQSKGGKGGSKGDGEKNLPSYDLVAIHDEDGDGYEKGDIVKVNMEIDGETKSVSKRIGAIWGSADDKSMFMKFDKDFLEAVKNGDDTLPTAVKVFPRRTKD